MSTKTQPLHSVCVYLRSRSEADHGFQPRFVADSVSRTQKGSLAHLQELPVTPTRVNACSFRFVQWHALQDTEVLRTIV